HRQDISAESAETGTTAAISGSAVFDEGEDFRARDSHRRLAFSAAAALVDAEEDEVAPQRGHVEDAVELRGARFADALQRREALGREDEPAAVLIDGERRGPDDQCGSG